MRHASGIFPASIPLVHAKCTMLHSMENDARDLAAAIGERVRRERIARTWTLDQLAEAAGVSRRLVVNVEQGTTNPSVATLLRLSEALGVGLPALVELPRSPGVQVTPAGEGAVLWRGDAGGRGVLLAGVTSPEVVELWEWTLSPGERHESEAHTRGTRELIHVHEGVLALTVGEHRQVLTAGDAVAFSGDLPHAYAADESASARFSLAVFEPGPGSGHGERS